MKKVLSLIEPTTLTVCVPSAQGTSTTVSVQDLHAVHPVNITPDALQLGPLVLA